MYLSFSAWPVTLSVRDNTTFILGIMSRLFRNTARKIGLPPGTPVFTGRKKVDSLHVSWIDYNNDYLDEQESKEIEAIFPMRDTGTVSWITITGLHDAEKIEALARHFGIHPLVCEDILNPHQRPKVEIFDDHVFVTLKVLDYEPENRHIGIDQVSLILGSNFVLCFQEKHESLFKPLFTRIREHRGRIRKVGPDYLLYAIMDMIIDHYFLNLESISDQIEKIEEQLMSAPDSRTLNEIYQIKREVLFLRKSVWPLRESIGKLERSESELINEKTIPYLRDLYDHTIQVIDSVETNRDLLAGMLDLYLSSVSYRMNQVMKMLTIIATIFIPLTFVVGIYGMNFEYMPELGWRYGYFGILGIMLAIALGMLVLFRRRKWI
ncbi:magnesium/cobalt transporter CorA [Balneolales bacterium ANBcel1]|nr:magnesium/cobalt transporter CorA [Balneolales bacterium ANBcel1]